MISQILITFFRFINRFFEWHKLPKWIAVINLIALRTELRKRNLHDTSEGATYKSPDYPMHPKFLHSRTPDGSYNDLTQPSMGNSGQRFGRNVPLQYTFPESDPEILKPSPREISRKLMTRDAFIPAKSLNLLAAAWIQFQVHDWFDHGGPQISNTFKIGLAEDDEWYQSPMEIRRTSPDPNPDPPDSKSPPTYINHVSHWWDLSAIYGSDLKTTDSLRSRKEGKLKLNDRRLPVDYSTGLPRTGFNKNWWIGLALLHTLFSLEHNAICDRLKHDFPHWSDEHLFQTARLINAALTAKIHTIEWTPAIISHPVLKIAMNANWWGLAMERVNKIFGRISKSELISGIPGSRADQHGVPYALTEEFVSVYRMHPLIPDDLIIFSIDSGEKLKELEFKDFFAENARGVVDDKVTMADVFYSFGISHPGAITLHNYPRSLQNLKMPDGDGSCIDLAAVDIMRDRERGVPRYNKFRELLGLPLIKKFEDITENKDWIRELNELYEGDVNRVDLMVGLLAETRPRGFGFSDTAFRIFIVMASFTTDYTPEVYTQAGLNWINENDMSSVILRHYPELKPFLSQVDNAFAPWNKVHDNIKTP